MCDPNESSKKRNRSTNFTNVEVEFLLFQMESRITYLESKKTDNATNVKKKQKWQEIYEEFVSNYPEKKSSVDAIKDLWSRMKMKAKTEFSKFNKERKKTGSGTPPPEPSALCLRIMNLIPNQFNSLVNNFDDDASDTSNHDLMAQCATEISESDQINVTQHYQSIQCVTQSDLIEPSCSLSGSYSHDLEKENACIIKQPFQIATKDTHPIKKAKLTEQSKSKENVAQQSPGCNDIVQMRRVEHEKRLRNLDLKNEVLTLQKRFWEKQLCLDDNS